MKSNRKLLFTEELLPAVKDIFIIILMLRKDTLTFVLALTTTNSYNYKQNNILQKRKK